MVKVKIITVGELNEKFYIDTENEFKKRLSKFCNLEFVVIKEHSNLNIEQKKQCECAELKKYFSKETSVLLYIDGKQLSSPQFAELIKEKRDLNSKIEFFIGGSNGVTDEFANSFKNKISFGKITLPHCLCKIVLEEQIYRAFQILNNSPYHK